MIAINWSHPLTYGLVAWYLALPGQTIGGTRFRDLCQRTSGTLSGMAIPGSAISGLSPAATRPGAFGELLFDGVDDYLDVTDDPFLDSPMLTVSVWVKRSGAQGFYAVIVDRQGGTNGWVMYFYATGNHLGGFLQNGGGVSSNDLDSTFLIPDGIWTHVVMTYDGLNVRFYGNGALVRTAAYTGGIGNSPTTMTIGARDSETNPSRGGFSKGSFDDIRIYKRALSQIEIQNIYFNALQGYPSILSRTRPWAVINGTIYPSTADIFMYPSETPNTDIQLADPTVLMSSGIGLLYTQVGRDMPRGVLRGVR
jgi:hypothetical protein